MKNALILHGTADNSQKNWFPWLHRQLEQNDFEVWTPDLPHAEKPNIQRYNQFILANKAFSFNDGTILIGHSSGAVAALGLLQALPPGTQINACYLVGAFKDDLGWKALKDLFIEPLDFQNIKTKAKKFIFIHSDNDPYCPLEHAEYLAHQLAGELIVKPGQKHFSIGTAGESYKEFPFLRDLILET